MNISFKEVGPVVRQRWSKLKRKARLRLLRLTLGLSTSRSKERTAPLEAECDYGAIGTLYKPTLAATPPLGGVAGGSALRKSIGA